MNKKGRRQLLIFGIIVFLCIGIVFMQKRFGRALLKSMDAVEEKQEEIYSQPGFSNPAEEWNEEADGPGKVEMISEAEFKKIENPSECTALHFDMSGEDMSDFVAAHVNDWYRGEWTEDEYALFTVGKEGNTETFYDNNKSFYLNNSEMSEGNRLWKVDVGYDAVSGRLHNIVISLPEAEGMRQAFISVMAELGEETADSGKMYDEVIQSLDALEWDRYIFYEQDGYRIYMTSKDYSSNMKKYKQYWVSISPKDI